MSTEHKLSFRKISKLVTNRDTPEMTYLTTELYLIQLSQKIHRSVSLGTIHFLCSLFYLKNLLQYRQDV